jgi:hypothetical protein
MHTPEYVPNLQLLFVGVEWMKSLGVSREGGGISVVVQIGQALVDHPAFLHLMHSLSYFVGTST